MQHQRMPELLDLLRIVRLQTRTQACPAQVFDAQVMCAGKSMSQDRSDQAYEKRLAAHFGQLQPASHTCALDLSCLPLTIRMRHSLNTCLQA